MDKELVRQKMLSLEAAELKFAQHHYRDYLNEAKLDRSEPIDEDERAQAETSRRLSEAFDDSVHEHAAKLASLKKIDFGPKMKVEEGAVVKMNGKLFVVGIATSPLLCDGQAIIGLSTQAPIFEAIAGLSAGDMVDFMGKTLMIESVS